MSHQVRDIIFRSLITKFAPQKKERLLSFWPSLENINTQESGVNCAFEKNLLEMVHYSWFLPALKECDKELLALYIAAFPDHAQKRLQALLQTKLSTLELTNLARQYLTELLSQKITSPELLPITFLPKDALLDLVNASKEELLQLIDALGIYDLAAAMPTIVDAQLLKAINKFLTIKKRPFFNYLLKKKPKPLFSDLTFDERPTDNNIYLTLHSKGLIRLALALSDSNKSLVWYIAHILDHGRGEILIKLSEKKPQEKTYQIILKNIAEAQGFLKAGKESAP